MKGLFEEYGRTALVIIAVAAVLTLVFVRLDLFGVMGSVADVNSGVSHDQSESALNQVLGREKPKADFSGVDLHIYSNHVFQPLKGVKFTDANGATVTKVYVTSIAFYDTEGNKTEYVDRYNKDDDVVVLNASHYDDTHGHCAASEFAANGAGKLVVAAGAERNLPGVVTVTYIAIDGENQVTTEHLTFVIDSKKA